MAATIFGNYQAFHDLYALSSISATIYVCVCVCVCVFHTSDQREKSVHKCDIALALEC